MPACTHCGAPLGAGRFCTSCGATPAEATPLEDTRVRARGWGTDTAERAAVRVPDDATGTVAVPPPAVGVPPSQRFPMYADELADEAPTGTPEPAYVAPARPTSHLATRPGAWPSWLPVAVLAAATLVVGVAVVALLTGRSDSPAAAPHPNPHGPAGGTSTAGPSRSSHGATGSSSGQATEVAGLARATAPRTAPAGVDLTGRPVDYEATNLLDGHPDTCWRTPGDATGLTLRFTLDQATRLSRVGLVNGYAKTAHSGGRTFDWYAGDRRVLRATWIFDDDSQVSQSFRLTRALQTTKIHPVTTRTVRLRLTAVSAPGSGPSARDYTALSEVSLVGSAA